MSLTSKSKLNFSTFSKFIIILLTILTVIIVYLGPYKNYTEEKSSGPSFIKNLSDNSKNIINNHSINFTNVSELDYTVSEGLSHRYHGVSNLKFINDKNLVLTFLKSSNINMNDIPLEILDNTAIFEEIDIDRCIYVDQLAVDYVTKTCQSSKCYTNFGNKILQGTSIKSLEKRENIPHCEDSSLGYLSFNFFASKDQNDFTQTVSKNSFFLTFEYFYMGQNIYNTLKKNQFLEYYFNNNIFILDSDMDSQEIVPRLLHKPYDSSNFKQRLLLKRYSKKTEQGNTTYLSNPRGSLAEIVFRQAGLYLDAVEAKNSIYSISLNSQDLVSLNITTNLVRKVKQNNNITAKCMLVNNGKDFFIIDSGYGYDENQTVSIQNNNGTFIGSFKISTSNSKRLIMKIRNTEGDISKRAVWLLAAPLDLNPQTITKSNKITKGYMVNFSKEKINIASLPNIPNYIPVNPGTIISGISLPAQESKTIYEFKGDNITQAIGDLIAGNDTSTNSNLKQNNVVYGRYPEYLYKAINTYPAFSDPLHLINGAIIDSGVSKYTDLFNSTGYDITVSYTKDDNFKPDVVDSDIIIDGTAKWQLIDPFIATAAFKADYFTKTNYNPGVNVVTKISKITTNGKNYIEPIYGKIQSVDTNSSNYNNITIPEFNESKIVKLDNTTLTLSENSTGVIGENAEAILNFIKVGTSTFIENVLVSNPGASFSTGTFNLLGSGISPGLPGFVENVSIKTFNDVYDFKAVAVNSSNSQTPVSNNPDSNIKISFGLTVDPLNDKQIDLNKIPKILDPGQNYNVNDKIYINQYFSGTDISAFGFSFSQENLSKDPSFLEELPSLNVLGVSTNILLSPSPYPLIPNISSEDKIEFNFWQDSVGEYNDSPQQILYYGDFLGVSSNFIGDPADSLQTFLLENKIAQTAFTDAIFLQSLQIPSFNYIQDESVFSLVEYYEGLVLKRFIPYSDFTPPKSSSDDNLPDKTGDIKYINYNNCQFVPYGLESVYNQVFRSTLPTF